MLFRDSNIQDFVKNVIEKCDNKGITMVIANLQTLNIKISTVSYFLND